MHRVAVLLAQGFEEIEAFTPVDMIRRTNIEVVVVATKNIMVSGSHCITVKADALLREVTPEEFTMIILPGGAPGSENLGDDVAVIEFIQAAYNHGAFIGAICAAPAFVLAEADLLDGRHFTSNPSVRSDIEHLGFYSEEAVVVDGQIITSRGPGTASKFGKTLLSLLTNNEEAEKLFHKMLF